MGLPSRSIIVVAFQFFVALLFVAYACAGDDKFFMLDLIVHVIGRGRALECPWKVSECLGSCWNNFASGRGSIGRPPEGVLIHVGFSSR